MRTVLITGGAGFIGSNFVHHWMRANPGDRVVVLDALTYAGNPANLAAVRENSQFRFVHGKIQDSALVDELFLEEPFTHVVNFAADSHNDRSMLDPGGLVQTNVYGVAVLLEAARKHGIERFVQVSTDEVYGEIDSGLFTEEHPIAPRTPYAAGKAGGDLQVRAHVIAFGAPALVTRGSNTFGPHQYPEKLLPFFITRAMRDKKLPVYGDGTQVRDWIYARDHCTGITCVLERGESGGIYNVGGGNERRNIDVVRKILTLLDKPESLLKHIADPRGAAHDKRYALDSSKLRALGWRPANDFETDLESTVKWYVENESWWKPIIESAAYKSFVSGYYGPYLGDDL